MQWTWLTLSNWELDSFKSNAATSWQGQDYLNFAH